MPKLHALAQATATVSVRQIDVKPGEFVTVWLCERDRHVQVELHVTTDGEARVLMAAEHHDCVKTFAEVYGS
jgi:hypothetical protein